MSRPQRPDALRLLIEAEVEASWTQEIASRVTELRAGKAAGVPFEEALASARARLAARGCAPSLR